MFPDRASLYVVAIEDRQYKDYKIHCEYRGRVGCVCVYVFTRIGPRSVFPALTGGKKLKRDQTLQPLAQLQADLHVQRPLPLR